MSEKIKGMFGSETRADEVLEWLKSQGAKVFEHEGNVEGFIYYVDKGQVKVVNNVHSVLFDIVELPRWRAEYDGRYYYMSDGGRVCSSIDRRYEDDNERYKVKNYFKTREEVEPYVEKFCKIFKRKE